ncbi:MAG TPA: hypothetical protein DCM28_13680 [Phycisphaerales bacterium]|nr:hypothetical protein [Phycisphaerales bacterium]|tara:strand:- start:1903 stop:2130 length:228 start_codon:yes stop_codon:yes gene_type:complete
MQEHIVAKVPTIQTLSHLIQPIYMFISSYKHPFARILHFFLQKKQMLQCNLPPDVQTNIAVQNKDKLNTKDKNVL